MVSANWTRMTTAGASESPRLSFSWQVAVRFKVWLPDMFESFSPPTYSLR